MNEGRPLEAGGWRKVSPNRWPPFLRLSGGKGGNYAEGMKREYGALFFTEYAPPASYSALEKNEGKREYEIMQKRENQRNVKANFTMLKKYISPQNKN